MTETTQTPEQPGPETAPPDRADEYIADISFDDLNLSEPVRRAVRERGYANPTPVQAKAFAPTMEGRDLIVRSKTGTGKTAAFGLPLLEKIDAEERWVRALILCPTRELALQVAAEIGDLGKYKGIKIAAIYGGSSMKQQEDALIQGAQIAVGTPGRVLDLIGRGILKLDRCSVGVLDEADEMLNQGFYEDVTRILRQLPKKKQILLFSATVPPEIQSLIATFTHEPQTLLLSGDVLTVDHIHHIRYEISDEFPKPRNLIYVLEVEQPQSAIVFCNTRDDTSLVTKVLNRNGFDAELLNGDLPQKERERVMAKVKRGEVEFMVATDIAARGIDISDLPCVVNYSLPEDPAVYLHRVGRTGRIGKKGTAINLTSGRELSTLTTLERKFNIKFEKKTMPTPEEAMSRYTERHLEELRETMTTMTFEGMLPLADHLKTRGDAQDLIAFLLKYFFSHHRVEKVQGQAPAEGAAPAETSSYEERPRRDRDRGERGDRGGRRGERGDRGDRPPRHYESEGAGPSRPKRSDADLFTSTGGSEGSALPPQARTAERTDRGEEPRRERSSRGEGEPRRERSERSDRGERTPRLTEGPGQVKFWINLGKADGVHKDNLPITLETLGAPFGKVQGVDVRQAFSFILVPEAEAAGFEALTGKLQGAKALKLERAKKEEERSSSSSEGGEGRERRRDTKRLEEGPGQVKLWLGLGQQEIGDEAGLAKALEELGAPAGSLQATDVRDHYSYVLIPEGSAAAFEALAGKSFKDGTLKLERARKPEDRKKRPAPEDVAGQARLWLNVGRADGLDEAGLTRALEAAGAPAGKVLSLDLRGTFSFLQVAEADATAFEGLTGKKHGEKELKLERAKRR